MHYIKFLFNQYPKRVKRLLFHWIFPFIKNIKNPVPPKNLKEWLIDLFFFTWDVFGIPELYTGLNKILKCNIRKLADDEAFWAKEIFGESLNTEVILVDSHALIGTEKLALAYVSFNLINYKRPLPNHVFVHELVHVWQFQNLGSIYIGRALQAQMSPNVYDYGGPENLFQQMIKGKRLLDYNFEQQAEIIEDYFRLYYLDEWQRPIDLTVYEYFKQDLYV